MRVRITHPTRTVSLTVDDAGALADLHAMLPADAEVWVRHERPAPPPAHANGTSGESVPVAIHDNATVAAGSA